MRSDHPIFVDRREKVELPSPPSLISATTGKNEVEDFFLPFILWTCGPCRAICHLAVPSPFLFRHNLFCPISSFNYLKCTSLNIFNFRDFSKNPVFEVHPTSDASKIMKNLTVLEFNEIRLGY